MTSLPPTAAESQEIAGGRQDRRLTVTACGDTSFEIERNAISEASEFFGPHAALEVDGYLAYPAPTSPRPQVSGSGKKYYADLCVRWRYGPQ